MPGGDRLPREILRWLQSLDLAYSVKSVKRDFANGFLIAEIFSRYDAKSIHMHSYDNGISIRARKDNWKLLRRYFKKKGILVQDDEVDAIIYCKSGAVVPFLSKLYTLLTQRQVMAAPTRPKGVAMPPFAKPTATSVVRDAIMKELGDTQDIKTTQSMLNAKLDQHAADLQEQRSLDPARFATSSTASGLNSPTKVLRGTMGTVGAASAAPQISVKKVNVKNIDRNIAHLRAKHGSAPISVESPTASSSKANATPGKRGSRGGGALGPGQPGPNARDTMNAAVKVAVIGTPAQHHFAATQEGADMSVEFIGMCAGTSGRTGVDRGGLSDETCATCFEEMATPPRLAAMAAACREPAQLHAVMSLLTSAVAGLPAEGAALDGCVSLMLKLGEAMVAEDEFMSTSLFTSIALPIFATLLQKLPAKRPVCMRIMPAFYGSAPAKRVEMIRKFKGAIGDLDVFIRCLALLLKMEEPADLTDHIFDLYAYYCVIGLGRPSATLRAVSLSMLPGLASASPEIATDLLPRLVTMAADPWWEIQAQLMSFASVILQLVAPTSPLFEVAADLIRQVLTPASNPNVKLVGLATLLPVISERGTTEAAQQLLADCLARLLQMSTADRARLLTTGPIALGAGDAASFDIVGVLDQWDPLAIVDALSLDVQDRKLDYIEIEQMEVIGATLSVCPPGLLAEDEGRWVDVLGMLKDYIFIALCDPDCCDLAIAVLRSLVFASASLRESVLHAESLVGALRLLFPAGGGGDPQCQLSTCAFLKEGLNAGGAVAADFGVLLDAASQHVTPTAELQQLIDRASK